MSKILVLTILSIGTTAITEAFAETSTTGTPHMFGDCVVATASNRPSGLALFCGVLGPDSEKKHVNIDEVYDKATKKYIPVIILGDDDIVNKVTGKFVFGENCSANAYTGTLRTEWNTYEPDLSRWDGMFRCLMSSPTLSVEGPFGKTTVDITGLSQAFQYFTEQFKIINHRPFPGWH